jgi:LemA protein
MLALIVIAALILVIALAAARSYLRFLSQSRALQNLWADVETELRQRHELIRNLVASVQEHAADENAVFGEVERTCAAAEIARSAAASAAAEGPVTAAVEHLIALAEIYPDLKAYQNFQLWNLNLSTVDERIVQTLSQYNAAVRRLNRRVQAFPSSLVAGVFHFRSADFFETYESGPLSGAQGGDR